MTPFYVGIFLSTTGQVYDITEHVSSIEWIDKQDGRVTVLCRVRQRMGIDTIGNLICEVHKWQTFTLIYGATEHGWNTRKARVILDDVPVGLELEFVGEEWLGKYY